MGSSVMSCSPPKLYMERICYASHCSRALKRRRSLPNGIYQLGLSAGAIAVYGYLFYIEYVSCEPPGSLKELFSEGYNADDDSFEGAETEQA